MENIMIWVWLVVFALMLIIEFITADYLTIWFALSAIPTIVIAAFLPDFIWLQVIVFFVIGFLMMIVIRKYVVKYAKKNIVPTNVDSFIGKNAIVIETIRENVKGLVKFENDTWTAVSNELIYVDELVVIKAIEGNKLIVVKVKEEEK